MQPEYQNVLLTNYKVTAQRIINWKKFFYLDQEREGDYHRSSDIDLAVFTKRISHTEQNLIEHAINEMSTPLKIDVVFMDRLKKEKLISNIIKEGVIIYEQRL